MEIEENNKLSFLDVLVERRNNNVLTSVYRKPTHTGRYLNFDSNHSGSTKIGVAKSLLHRADTHCSTNEARAEERKIIQETLLRNGFKHNVIKKIMQPKATKTKSNTPEEEHKHLLCIPYTKGISEEIRRVAAKLNIKTVFQTTSTIRSLLGSNKPKNSSDTKDCIYQVPCECGKSYVGETKRPLETRLREHLTHTKRGETTKSGLADHAWENKHKIQWENAKIIKKEQHWFKRKFWEAAIITTNKEIFSNPSVEIKPVWKKFIHKDPTLSIKPPTTTYKKPNTLDRTSPAQTPPATHYNNNNKHVTLEHTSRIITHPYNTRYKNRN